MSPHQAQRRAAWALVAGVVAVGALILSVWLVRVSVNADLRDESLRAVRQQTTQLRAGCARGVARDFEALGTNRDLRDLATDAARARRADGNEAIARRYEQRAASAELRMARVRLRVPAREDEASVGLFCRALYPEPTPSAG